MCGLFKQCPNWGPGFCSTLMSRVSGKQERPVLICLQVF
jgi:hypothetical protein